LAAAGQRGADVRCPKGPAVVTVAGPVELDTIPALLG